MNQFPGVASTPIPPACSAIARPQNDIGHQSIADGISKAVE
jgi:hypothetical protein